eukprot:544420_1
MKIMLFLNSTNSQQTSNILQMDSNSPMKCNHNALIHSTFSRSATKWIIAILNINLNHYEMVSIMILVIHICGNIIFSALVNDDFNTTNNIYKHYLVITTFIMLLVELDWIINICIMKNTLFRCKNTIIIKNELYEKSQSYRLIFNGWDMDI